MAIHFDTSSNMNKEQIKKILTNVFSQESKRNVSNANYDRTILGSIQSCVDASLGQYKVKYQNGYLTAYSNELNVVYSTGTPVYITVPENNFNNRLTISAIATSDSSAKTYTTFLEDAQRYEKYGPNLILTQPSQTNMSSYAGELDESGNVREKEYYLYRRVIPAGTGTNSITLNKQYTSYLKDSGSLWLGASFQTSLEEDRKTSGDYGLVLGVRYKKDVNGDVTDDNVVTRTYVLDTFHMVGNPFEFSTPMSQYAIWEIDSEGLIDIDYIKTYVKGFPYSGSTVRDTDITVSSLFLYGANVLYDSNNDTYKIELIRPEGDTFETSTSADAQLPVTAILRVNGNPVTSTLESGIQFWWAKKNVSVNSIGNRKYNSFTGEGWECLNTRNVEQFVQAQDIADLRKDPATTVVTDENEDEVKYFTWKPDTAGSIGIKKSKCKSRITSFKVVAYYNNTIIDRVFEIKNENGIYVLLESAGGTQFYNGSGFTNLIAKAFRDDASVAPSARTAPIPVDNLTYHWVEQINSRTRELPLTNSNDILLLNEVWDQSKDNEEISDEEVQAYLDTNSNLYCLNRYNYYTNKASDFTGNANRENISEEEKAVFIEKATLCETRAQQTVSKKYELIQQNYIQNFTNNENQYVCGNADIQAKYTSDTDKNYSTAALDLNTVNYNYYGTSGYNNTVNNVLYKLSASNITTSATYSVSAIDAEGDEVGTVTVRLTNQVMTSTRYSLVITNGEQVFVYNEAGKAPNTPKGSDNPMTLRPLFFRLYDNLASEGDGLIYDSENETSINNEVSIASLKPKWKFYGNGYSLLTNKYSGVPNCVPAENNGNYYILSNEASFVYGLKEDFNQNLRYQSNIELEVVYNDERVVGGTNFTFLKEGDLGTNGTGLNLDIYQPSYEAYRDGVLTSFDRFSETDENGNTSVYYYSPYQRHLSNVYLYATKKYSEDPNCVNLKFGTTGNGSSITGASTVKLRGQWFNNGVSEDLDASKTEWSLVQFKGGTSPVDNLQYKNVDSFDLDTSSLDGTATLKLIYDYDSQWKFAPFERIKTDGGIQYHVIGSNIVKLKSTYSIPQQNTERVDYAYYSIPYFFYSATDMDSNIDVTTRFSIVGGFDTIMYDSTGANPQYAREPFKIYLKDKDGNDITSELKDPKNASKVNIRWDCSYGFVKQSRASKPYSSYASEEQLYGKYCSYNNQIYKCNTRHTKPTNENPIIFKDGKNTPYKIYYSDKIVTYSETGQEIVTDFNSNTTPVFEYWEVVDSLNSTEQSFTPLNNYESLVSNNLFNSWISVVGSYEKDATHKYYFEAFLPINIYCNRYGSEILNNWDGKSLTMSKNNEPISYMISNQVAAGIKEDDNSFTGITIGERMYERNDYHNEVGLFGYGKYKEEGKTEADWGRTIFMDARTGRTILGPSGSNQIILDPNADAWSRLAGWYFNKNYLYKPVWRGPSYDFNSVAQGMAFTPPTSNKQSIGLYCPYDDLTQDDLDKPFIWASGTQAPGLVDKQGEADFYVTLGGYLYAQNADIAGRIQAKTGNIGGADGIQINYTKGDEHFILYNDVFKVQDQKAGASENSVYIKGKVMAKEGQFGNVRDDANGTDSSVCFIWYDWYPWVYPSDKENFEPYYDANQPMETTYVLYHKNFHLERGGDAYFNGDIYAKKGRIGGWVIKSNAIQSVGYGDKTGLKLSNNGKLEGPNWYINPDGTSSFGKEARFGNLCNSNGQTIINASGDLEIPSGHFMKIGDGKLQAWGDGKGASFTGDVYFNDNLRILTQLQFSSESYSAMWLDSSGVHFNGKDGDYSIDSQGRGHFYTLSAGEGNVFQVSSNGDVLIKGKSLEDYIKSVITKTYIEEQLGNVYVKGVSYATSTTDETNKFVTSVSVTR